MDMKFWKFVEVKKNIKTTIKPSTACLIERSLISRELAYLTQECSFDPIIIAYRRKVKQDRKKAIEKRKQQQYKTVSANSYAQVLRKDLFISDNTSVEFISREEARWDARQAYLSYEKQLQDARLLVDSIAKRYHSNRLMVLDPSAQRLNRLDRMKRLREIRKMKRYHKKEVQQFSSKCYFAQTPEDQNEAAQWEDIPRGVVRPTSVKQIKQRSFIRENWRVILRDYVPHKPKEVSPLSERIKYLKFRLRLKILSFRDPIYVERLLRRVLRPQMETEGKIVNDLSSLEKRSTTVIASSSTEEVGQNHPNTQGLTPLAVTGSAQNLEEFADRWLYLTTLNWTDANAIDTNLLSADYVFPKKLLEELPSSQAYAALMTHRFFKCDLVFKFVLNSSPWQIGQLIATWTYGRPGDTKDILNIPCAIQRNHAMLTAGSTNNVELRVPYHFYNSMLSNYTKQCYYGYLSLLVINSLSYAKNVASSASISIYVALENVQVEAKVARSLAEKSFGEIDAIQGQMLPVGKLCNLGGNTLLAAGKLIDRDNPPLALQPVHFIPQATPSFCYTTKVEEPIHVLRADPRGQFISSFNEDIVTPNDLAKRWGFIGTRSWNMNDNSNKLIWSLPIMPIMPDIYYYGKEPYRPPGGLLSLPQSYYTPLAVISSCFAYWRGSIKVRIDVIANSYYTGSLKLASIPVIGSVTNVSLSEMGMSSSVVFDIQKTSSIIVSIPYNWVNAWCPLKTMEEDSAPAPNTLFVKVLNPLIGIANVPSIVKLNFYVCAGDDFELALMRTPSIALTGKYLEPKLNKYLNPWDVKDVVFVSYIGGNSGEGLSMPIMVFDTGHTDWVGYTNVRTNKVYELHNTTSLGYQFSWTVRLQNSKLKEKEAVKGVPILYNVKYALWTGLSTGNAHGLAVFDTAVKAAQFLKYLIKHTNTGNVVDLQLAIKDYIVDFPDEYIFYKADSDKAKKYVAGSYIDFNNEAGDYFLWKEYRHVNSVDYEVITPQMNVEGVEVSFEKLSLPTGSGFRTFGEEGHTLKSLARRWQHFGSVKFETCAEKYPRDCAPACRFPVRPKRVFEPDRSGSYDNRIRDGNINLLSSGFAFWTGGMRYRFVVVGDVPHDAVIYVQHRFDEITPDTDYIDTDIKVKDSLDLMDTHFATAVQALNVNTVLSVEVPYYQTRERLVTNREFKQTDQNLVPATNGMLYVWLHSELKQNVTIEIYYSVADDFSWSVFQGFPAMINLAKVSDWIEPQADVEPIEVKEKQGMFSKLKSLVSSSNSTAAQVRKTAASIEKDVSIVSQNLTETTENMNCLLEKCDRIVSIADGWVSKRRPAMIERQILEGRLQDTKDRFTRETSVQGKPDQGILEDVVKPLMQEGLELSFPFVTHVIYAIINPKASTVAWSIVNLYKECFGLTLDGFAGMTEALVDLWRRSFGAKQQNQPQAPTDMECQISGLCSILFCSLCTITKLSISKPKSWQGVSDGLFQFSQNCRASQNVASFIRDNITLFKRIWQKMVNMFKAPSKDFQLVSGTKDDRLKAWCAQTYGIVAPGVREKVLNNSCWAEKVFELAIVGRGLSLQLTADKTVPSGIIRLVTSLLDEVKKLEMELINRKSYCAVRYDPFCLWSAGDAGTGKSRFNEKIAERLQQRAGHQGLPYHAITVNQQYFDGFVGQPTVLIDDFLAMDPSQDATVPMFIQMKSSNLFNPPFSAIKDKATLVNFQNLLISSNTAFISTGKVGFHDADAFNRRRNALLIWKKRKDYDRVKVEAMPPEERNKYYEDLNQVDIYYVEDPANQNSPKIKLERQKDKPYSEVVMDYVMSRAEWYHTGESLTFARRCADRITSYGQSTRSVETLNEYLSKVTKDLIIDHRCESKTFEMIHRWMGRQIVEPQGDHDNLYWPYFKSDLGVDPNDESLVKDAFIEPCSRKDVGWTGKCGERIFLSSESCLHRKVIDFDMYDWSHTMRCFIINEKMLYGDAEIPTSFPYGRCVIKREDGFEECDKCLMADDILGKQFHKRLFQSLIKRNPTYAGSIEDGDEVYGIPKEYASFYKELNDTIEATFSTLEMPKHLADRVTLMQREVKEKFQQLGESTVPRKSIWKTIPNKIWRIFCATMTAIWKIFKVITYVMGFIGSLMLIGGVTAATVNHFTTPEEQRTYVPYDYYDWKKQQQDQRVCMVPKDIAASYGDKEPNLHASGDFKTMKAMKSVRTHALSLAKPNGGDIILQADIEKYCRSKQVNPQHDGRLKKIVNNTFTLVGIVPLEGEECHVFPVRCVGLYHHKFLVLKHYIEHFSIRGVQKIGVVFHAAKGVIYFSPEDIEYEWTPEGYGTGLFPSLPRQFANIVRYMPPEKMMLEYPRNMFMVEVDLEGIVIHPVECDRIRRPVSIPSFEGQSPWKITQGFSYEWGGPGKCGSFLFAPELATPLIGVHTAGKGLGLGFSEMLLRETFIDEIQELPFEMVIPEMSIDENKVTLPGLGFQVGTLPQDRAVSISNKTKIIPSELSGIFPIHTEPAPLDYRDARLSEPIDPLIAGIEKRCKKPKEFPIESLRVAFDDYQKLILTKVKPLRTVGELSVSQAVEGLTIEGYEPIEMSTSEGYPWVLDRPRLEKNKQWMFELGEYPDGRRKLLKIVEPLDRMLKIKNEMRLRGITPQTYFTACLKDARIPLEKIPKVGGTRVFEMSPVDLTIAQRQLFLDFYAAFQSARLQVEHTVGINPDGPEWTDLSSQLLEFSPFIITADYSSFGPRLLHSVLLKANLIDISWYDLWLTKQGCSEDELAEAFLKRMVCSYEYTFPLIVVKNMVCLFNCGMQSGNCATVLKNTQVNSLYIRVAYLELAKKYAPTKASMGYFRQYVLLFTNGDDLIASVKEDIIEWFNNQTLIEHFAHYDIKMTDAQKSGKIRPYCSLEEATYLKRGFKKHPFREGQWLAPLDKKSIEDTANWIWKSFNDREASLVNAEMCIRNAYSQGPKYFNWVKQKIERAWMLKGVTFVAPTWKALDNHVWDGEEGPKFCF